MCGTKSLSLTPNQKKQKNSERKIYFLSTCLTSLLNRNTIFVVIVYSFALKNLLILPLHVPH